DAPDGWTRTLNVPLADPASASATFKLIGRDPTGLEPAHLTTLQARFVLPSGEVAGVASRALVIGRHDAARLELPAQVGTPWLAQRPAVSMATLATSGGGADLVIELVKDDANPATGRYVAWLRSPHAIAADRGPHPIDFGQDAKTFARTIVDQIRQHGATALV